MEQQIKLNAPIAIMDSGVGGLSILAEIRRLLPAEDLLYFADLANAPYGGRPAVEVRALTERVVDRLLRWTPKAIVLACNTATSAAVATVRRRLTIPVVGMEPAIKPAVEMTRTGHVAVLATELTLGERKFAELADRALSGVRLTRIAAPDLVRMVERRQMSGREVRRTLEGLMAPALAEGADVVVLGCTHFSFLRPVLRQALGERIAIVDGNQGTARQTVRVIGESRTVSSDAAGRIALMSSGDVERERRHLAYFLEYAFSRLSSSG